LLEISAILPPLSPHPLSPVPPMMQPPKSKFLSDYSINIFIRNSGFNIMIKYYLVIMAGVFLQSCSPKPEPEKLKEIIGEIEKKSKNENFTDNEWVKYQNEITSLTQDYENKKQFLTPEQRGDWNRLMGKYKAQLIKRGMDEIKAELQDLAIQAEGFVEEISK
jgi:hypothetical protein